jgi:alkylation response protein AidB-like acyl-CoA dehydrogenase
MSAEGPQDLTHFRQMLREFALQHCPQDIRDQVAGGHKITQREYLSWQKILHAQGWGAPSWPREHGGTGWDVWQRIAFEEVMAECDCPPLYHHGLGHIGPVIIRFGTEAQKQHFLPRILDGTDWWCQGYSEPGAGSDLASLQTRAERVGRDFIVNGHKIWTSHAHEASMIYMLVRTSRELPRHRGISLLLVPMDSPGITVKPIRSIDGWHHINEVFFDQVRVSDFHLVGEENQGWACAKYLLERERLPAASVARLMRLHQQVERLLRQKMAQGEPRDLHSLCQRLLLAEADLLAARETFKQATQDLIAQRPVGTQPSVLKLQCSDIAQRLTGVALDALGPAVAQRLLATHGEAADGAVWVQNYLFTRARTIAGGTSEVQRNVVARQLFGD